MSNIDEIALNVVKAIAEIDPDKLPGGRTQAVAQAQILVRDAISGEIEALKASNRDLQNWFDDARATAEQAQARVAELETVLRDLLNDCINFDGGKLTDRILKEASSTIETDHSEAFVLRKQAEAFESAAKRLSKNKAEWSWQAQQEMLHNATSYRQQADELEQPND